MVDRAGEVGLAFGDRGGNALLHIAWCSIPKCIATADETTRGQTATSG